MVWWREGSYGEAVVEIQMLPISSLVKVPFLHLAMQKARVEYSSTKGNKAVGKVQS